MFAGGEDPRNSKEQEMRPQRVRVTLTLALSGKVWSELMLILLAVITDKMFFDDNGIPISTHRVRIIIGDEATPRALMHFRVDPEMENTAGEVHLSVVLHRPMMVNARLELPHLYQRWFDRREVDAEWRLKGGSGHRKW